MRFDVPKMITTIALVVIAICAVIGTILLGKINDRTEDLYNVTAKPHCYLSPNDPRRREIERDWGNQPTTDGVCEEDARPID